MKKDNAQKQKSFIGKVVSLKTPGMAIVEVERKIVHPLYKKVLKRSKRFKVESNSIELALGDIVKIVETRPISKNKYFKILSDKKDKKGKNGSA